MGIIRGRRPKTAREEALHGKIQQAMNWSPDHFYKRKDGVYRNARGEVGQVVTLKELMDKYKKERPEMEMWEEPPSIRINTPVDRAAEAFQLVSVVLGIFTILFIALLMTVGGR